MVNLVQLVLKDVMVLRDQPVQKVTKVVLVHLVLKVRLVKEVVMV